MTVPAFLCRSAQVCRSRQEGAADVIMYLYRSPPLVMGKTYFDIRSREKGGKGHPNSKTVQGRSFTVS